MCTMPLYMDVHRDVDASVEEVVEAHKKDLETQEKHGVKYLNYWVDDDEGPSFASEGPSKRSEKVHKEAHGLAADDLRSRTGRVNLAHRGTYF